MDGLGEGEVIGRVVRLDKVRGVATVRLDHALDRDEVVAVQGRDAAGAFAAQPRIGGHPVARGVEGQEIELAGLPDGVREGDVLVRRTGTLGAMLRDVASPG